MAVSIVAGWGPQIQKQRLLTELKSIHNDHPSCKKTPAAETTEPHPAPGLAAVSLPKGVLSPFPRFSFFEYPASRHEHPLQTGVVADDNALIGISSRSL